MKFTLQNKYPTLGSLAEDYSDVEIHYEDCINGEKFFTSKKANKVILAMYLVRNLASFNGQKLKVYSPG